jgi:hypothetical protein
MAKELIEDYRIGWNFKKNNGGFSIKKREAADLIK